VISYANELTLRDRTAQLLCVLPQLLCVLRKPAASRSRERVRTKAPHRRVHRAKRSRIKPGERSRPGPHVRRSRRKGAPGAGSEASTPGRRRAVSVLRRTTAGQP